MKPMGLTRREFIRNGTLFMLAPGSLQVPRGPMPTVRIGLVTDVHYAECDARAERVFRDSLMKMRQAVETLGTKRLHFCVSLGDLIDGPTRSTAEIEMDNLRTINAEFARLQVPHYSVFGNHCVERLTKPRYLETVGQAESYFSFDRGGLHFIVLDACYRKDGVSYSAGNYSWTDSEIPPEQREWLRQDLAKTDRRTIVFCHQRLDNPEVQLHQVASAPEVRSILESSRKVMGVFMGHSHQNCVNRINDIPYVTLHAMVDGAGLSNNAYSVLHVHRSGSMKLEGFAKHSANPMCAWAPAPPPL